MPIIAALALLLLSLSCAPDRFGDVEAQVVAPAETGEYELRRKTVSNLQSLRELRGRDFHFRAASAVVETLGSARFDDGRPFSLEWTESDDGVVLPSDLHSLLALSAYSSLDETASYFRKHGFTFHAPLTVYFLPRYDHTLLGDLRSSLTDNAAFSWETRTLLLLPSFVLADLPLLLNHGVLAHELGHALIHEVMFGAATTIPEHGNSDRPWSIAHQHLLAMHEGVADLIGFVATGDSDFMRPSLRTDRDLSKPRELTDSQKQQLETPPQDGLLSLFEPHSIGTVMARAVFEMWPRDSEGQVGREQREEMASMLLLALARLDYHPDRFTLGSFPSALVDVRVEALETHDPEAARTERQRCCDVLIPRFGPAKSWLTACGQSP